MQRGRSRVAEFAVSFWLLIAFVTTAQCANAPKEIDDRYRQYFQHYNIDARSLKEKALNVVGLTDYKIGRSFALVAGVSKYQISGPSGDLKEAHFDIEHLVEYLKDFENFDEIVVLENEAATQDNLIFFLQKYFPSQTARFPRSRFLFAYSGHGMQSGPNGREGLLLTSNATSLDDTEHAISLELVRTFLRPAIESSYHSLILINSCYSGAFAMHAFGGGAIPTKPGAHAITAGGVGELTLADETVGPGSLFFETIITGIATGAADLLPKDGGDGVITSEELFTYVKDQVQHFTKSTQNPTFTNCLLQNAGGSFFFFNNKKFAAVGERPEWNPGPVKGFGTLENQELARAHKYYLQRKFPEAFQIYSAAAEKGDKNATKYVAHMYAYEQGVKRDMQKGRSIYEKLAGEGDAEAMLELGKTYYHDHRSAGDENSVNALLWFKKAAAAGNGDAMSRLGRSYFYGDAVASDPEAGLAWYEKAAKTGNSEAMRTLGDIRFYGDKNRKITKSPGEGLRWYTKAAEAGNHRAILALAKIYEEGKGGITTDYQEAMRWLKAGLVRGGPFDRAEAMAEIGRFYEEGKGVRQDFEQAISWYEKALELGGVHGTASLGKMYKEGHGVHKDYSKAFQLFERVLHSPETPPWDNHLDGYNIAWFEEGKMFEQGLGVTRDIDRAIECYRNCGEDHKEAKARLKKLGAREESSSSDSGWE